MELLTEMQRELKNAEQAKLEGKAGLSRVCARRAAGLSVRDYLSRCGISVQTGNNFELMKYPELRTFLPSSIHTALDHLTMTVDLDHNLPPGIDLIKDAQIVIEALS